MKWTGRVCLVSLALVFVSVAGGVGCAPKRVDLVSDGILALERVPEKRGYWRDFHVFQDGEELVVTGYVRRCLEPGLLKITILAGDGKRLAEKTQAVCRVRRSSRVRHTRFESRFRIFPPAGSVARILHLRGRIVTVQTPALKE